MEDFPDLLTFREAAKLLRATESILRRMVESRLLPLYHISGVIRFDRKDLMEYIEKHRTGDGGVDTYIARHKSHKKGCNAVLFP